MKKILFIGESWQVHVQEAKGFDVFTYDYYEEAIEYIQNALEKNGDIEFSHIPSHLVETKFPKNLEELKKYDVVMISDCGANTFNLPMTTFQKLEKVPNKLELIKEYVKEGGAFVMIGGYLTFQGIQGRGNWKNTIIEEILPVNLEIYDDRNERCQGVQPQIKLKNHPILKDMPTGDWPELLGYNRSIAKEEAEVIVEIENYPLLAVRKYDRGKTCAFASDCAPHWAPLAFCKDWPGYSILWHNIIEWLTDK